VPLKPALLAELKSNNYLLNALLMMEAQARGGTYGISVDSAGHVRESCVLNVCFVCPKGMASLLVSLPTLRVAGGAICSISLTAHSTCQLVQSLAGIMRTPPFLRVLKGTTVRRAFELAQVHLVATNTNGAAGTSLLQGIDQGREIASVELLQAREVFLLAGDTHGYAVTSIDGHQIGNGEPGPVFEAIMALLKQDAIRGDDANHCALDDSRSCCV